MIDFMIGFDPWVLVWRAFGWFVLLSFAVGLVCIAEVVVVGMVKAVKKGFQK